MSNVGYQIDLSPRASRCECGDACEDAHSPGTCAKGQLRFSAYSTSSVSRPRKYSWYVYCYFYCDVDMWLTTSRRHLACVSKSQVCDVCYTYGEFHPARASDAKIIKAIRHIERFSELDADTRRHCEEFLLALARSDAEGVDSCVRWIDSVFQAPTTPPQRKTRGKRGKQHTTSRSRARGTALRNIVKGAVDKPSSSGRKRVAALKIREDDDDDDDDDDDEKQKETLTSRQRSRRRERAHARRSSAES